MRRTGSEFIADVSHTIGVQLAYAKWIEAIYDGCERRGKIRVFEELAFEAKSFQKLTRVAAAGITDDSARKKIELEISESFKRFAGLLESVSDFLDGDGEQFRKDFLVSMAASFGNIRTLLDDFSIIKQFYLIKRDAGEGA